MKILHVWDQAGVASILAKYHRRMGHDVDILKRAGYDPFGISQFYGEPLLDLDGKSFLKHVVKQAGKYDIVHVHTIYKVIPELRKKHKGKKLVLHYHGSEIRGRQDDDSLRAEAEEKSDVILGSTPDLKDYVDGIVYVPNPVDTEHFRPDSQRSTGAFTISRSITDTQWMLDYLKKNNLDLRVEMVERSTNPIPYAQVPAFLKRYGIYIDIRYIDGILLANLSKTGLESLACGLRVLNHELKYVEGLPEEHKPEVVAARVLDIYAA
jgi:glycosyltransferase involved in cell wall biosynthesis